MARYIDADKLCKGLEEMASVLAPFKQSTILGVIETIKMTRSADVVPKSEVAHMLSDLKKEIHDKAVYPNCHGVEPYISLKVFDAVINKLIGS